jgi:hypothetical protein
MRIAVVNDMQMSVEVLTRVVSSARKRSRSARGTGPTSS